MNFYRLPDFYRHPSVGTGELNRKDKETARERKEGETERVSQIKLEELYLIFILDTSKFIQIWLLLFKNDFTKWNFETCSTNLLLKDEPKKIEEIHNSRVNWSSIFLNIGWNLLYESIRSDKADQTFFNKGTKDHSLKFIAPIEIQFYERIRINRRESFEREMQMNSRAPLFVTRHFRLERFFFQNCSHRG